MQRVSNRCMWTGRDQTESLVRNGLNCRLCCVMTARGESRIESADSMGAAPLCFYTLGFGSRGSIMHAFQGSINLYGALLMGHGGFSITSWIIIRHIT